MLFRGITRELKLEAEQKEASNIEFHWSDSFTLESSTIYDPSTVPTAAYSAAKKNSRDVMFVFNKFDNHAYTMLGTVIKGPNK